MTKDDGGPAFPTHRTELVQVSAETGDEECVRVIYPGMSLRDWFASTCPDGEVNELMPQTQGALLKFCEQHGLDCRYPVNGDRTPSEATVRTIVRYEYADAMLAARKETSDEN